MNLIACFLLIIQGLDKFDLSFFSKYFNEMKMIKDILYQTKDIQIYFSLWKNTLKQSNLWVYFDLSTS